MTTENQAYDINLIKTITEGIILGASDGIIDKSGSYIITCSLDGSLCIYSNKSFRLLSQKNESDNQFSSLIELSNDRILATGRSTKVYSIKDLKIECLNRNDHDHVGSTLAAVNLENGTYATVGEDDKDINIYDDTTYERVNQIKVDGKDDCLYYLYKYNNFLLAGNSVDGLFIFDTSKDFKMVKNFPDIIINNKETIIEYDKYLLFGEENCIKFLDMKKLKIAKSLEGEYSKILCFAKLEGDDLLLGNWEGEIVIINAKDNEILYRSQEMSKVFWLLNNKNIFIIGGLNEEEKDETKVDSKLQVYRYKKNDNE